MKIFVTGASGFIGNHLAERLVREKHDVTVLIRNPALIKVFRGMGMNVVNGDISDIEKLRRGMEGCEQVFHLAAYAKAASRDKDLPLKTNAEGTKNILKAAREQGIRRLIYTSTAGTLGLPENGTPVDERSYSSGEFQTEYERTKAIAEKMALEYTSEQMQVIAVNPTRVFGPGLMSQSNSVTKIISLYCSGFWRIIPGDGSSTGNYAFIDDVINGHILAAQRGKGGERYILGGENISFTELFDTIGKVSGKRRSMLKVSSANLKRVAGILNFLSKVAGRQPFITDNWIDKYLQNRIVSSNKAIKELSYSITPFEQGVARTVDWLRR
jgi:farnesol dehydrogenase